MKQGQLALENPDQNWNNNRVTICFIFQFTIILKKEKPYIIFCIILDNKCLVCNCTKAGGRWWKRLTQHESLQQTVVGVSPAGSTEMSMVMLSPTRGPKWGSRLKLCPPEWDKGSRTERDLGWSENLWRSFVHEGKTRCKDKEVRPSEEVFSHNVTPWLSSKHLPFWLSTLKISFQKGWYTLTCFTFESFLSHLWFGLFVSALPSMTKDQGQVLGWHQFFSFNLWGTIKKNQQVWGMLWVCLSISGSNTNMWI